MNSKEKKISRKTAPSDGARMIETIFGCKWSLTVYQLLDDGINRPGEMVRAVDGLTTKVLNECLRRNMQFGILEKINYPEIPPRVEYVVTELGQHFLKTVAEIESLQDMIDQQNS